MRLYLKAKSKNKIGYTPDWLEITFEDKGKQKELIFDIQGEIGYDEDSINCHCKVDLIPWVLCNCETGRKIGLWNMTDEEVENILPNKKIAQIISEGNSFRVGIFPVTNGDCDEEEVLKLAKNDVVYDGEGFLEMFVGEKCYEKEFEFETKLNL